jgi:hypothetical protein
LVGCVVTACQRQDRGDGQGAEKERSNEVTEKELAQVYYLRKEIKMWERMISDATDTDGEGNTMGDIQTQSRIYSGGVSRVFWM